METFQRIVTIVSVLVTVVLLVLQLRRAGRRQPVRPRLDLARVGVQLAGAVVVAALLGVRVPPVVLVAMAGLGLFAGNVQGRNLEITEEGGRRYATRSTVAVIVWAVGLIGMQTAGVLRRLDVAELGQVTAWFGVGLTVGVLLGRREPLRAQRAMATAVGAFGPLLGLVALGPAATGGDPPSEDRWVLTEVRVNPDGDAGPDRWEVTAADGAMSTVQTFGPDDDSGAEATFAATWDGPPEVVAPGETGVIEVSVSAEVTGNRDTQFFFGLDVIELVNGRWNDQAVGARASCVQTTVISGEYECSEPETTTGELTFTAPTSGGIETFEIGVGALNCGGACYVGYVYEFDAAALDVPVPLDDPVGDDPVGGDGATGEDPVDEDTTDGGPVDDDVTVATALIDELFDETGIEPDDAMAAALAGVLIMLGSGAITLAEAADRIADLFDRRTDADGAADADAGGNGNGDLPPPVAGAIPIDDELVLTEPDTASVGRTGSAFDEELAELVEYLPPPGPGQEIGPYLDRMGELMEAMAEQSEHWQRPFDPEELGRVWDALGAVGENPSTATADELRHALADLLDRQVGAVPLWTVSWAARNPAAAAELVTRLGVAYATGGTSEVALIPVDTYRDITAARDAAVAAGEEWTFADGVMAGLRGQAIGLVLDGAGAATNAGRGAAGETLTEIAARTEARAGARSGATVSADDLAEAARRNTDPGRWNGIDEARPGTKIPPEHIRDTGYTPEQAAEIQRVAAEENVIIGTRTTNPDSTRWIESGEAVPKSVDIKAKTINELDARIGGPPASHTGKVGFFEPVEPSVPRESDPELWARHDQRAEEWAELSGDMAALREAGVAEVRDGVVHRVMPDGSVRPFAGDVDPVVILDQRTGQPVTGRRYREVVDRLAASGAQVQHGAESHLVGDIVRNATHGMTPGTREYNEAFDRAMESATELGEKLDRNHLGGAEQVIWTHREGSFVGPRLTRLSGWQRTAGVDVPPRITDPVEAAAVIRSVGRIPAADDG